MTVRGALKIDRMHTGVEPRRPAFRCVSFFSHDISRYCMYSFSFFYRLLPLPACACPPGIGSQIARPEGFQPNQLHKPRFPEHLSDWTSGQSTRTCHHTHSCRTILATFPSPQPRRNTPCIPSGQREQRTSAQTTRTRQKTSRQKGPAGHPGIHGAPLQGPDPLHPPPDVVLYARRLLAGASLSQEVPSGNAQRQDRDATRHRDHRVQPLHLQFFAAGPAAPAFTPGRGQPAPAPDIPHRCDLAPLSLLRHDLVSNSLAIRGIEMNIVRSHDNRYNITDVFSVKRTGTASDIISFSELPFLFSLNNISIREGSVTFQDVPAATTHTVEQIELDLPSLSQFPLPDHARTSIPNFPR